ncbi:predicted protein, partial [Nematostella vectensis]
GGDIIPVNQETTAVVTKPAVSSGGELLDLLGGLDFGPRPSLLDGGATLGPMPGATPMMQMNDTTPPAPVAAPGGIPSITAYEKGGLKIVFSFEKIPDNPSNVVNITMTASNNLSIAMQEFVFQAAVPKTLQLQLQSPSGNVLPPNNGGTVTQLIRIANPQQNPLRMRIKLLYTLNGAAVQEQGEINSFPPGV